MSVFIAELPDFDERVLLASEPMPKQVMTIQASGADLSGLDTVFSLAKYALLGFAAWKAYGWLSGSSSSAQAARGGITRLGRSTWAGAKAARSAWSQPGMSGLAGMDSAASSSGVSRKPMTVKAPGGDFTVYVRGDE